MSHVAHHETSKRRLVAHSPFVEAVRVDSDNKKERAVDDEFGRSSQLKSEYESTPQGQVEM